MMSIQKIQEIRASKKRKGFSFMEILVALIMVVSLSVGAFFTYNDAQQTRKLAQMHNDMDALVTGCLVYEALSLNSTLPTALSDLTGTDADPALASANAVDGCDHVNFVTTVKADFRDPWNEAYQYSATERTISCTPNDANGNPMTTVTRRF